MYSSRVAGWELSRRSIEDSEKRDFKEKFEFRQPAPLPQLCTKPAHKQDGSGSGEPAIWFFSGKKARKN
jgi:hypothetical protein